MALSDIHKEMVKIFSEHLTQKHLTGKVMQKAIMHYINQFDPHQVYLLREDVRPFLTLSSYQLEREAEAFRQEDYAIFQKINKVCQGAIRKMRRYRLSLPADAAYFTALNKKEFSEVSEADKGSPDSFVDTQKALDERHAVFMAYLVRRELDSLKELNQPVSFIVAVRNVEIELEEEEDNYLYLDKLGKALDTETQEEMFAFQVLKALTASLDVHSQFLNSKEAESLRMKLEKEYTGVGIDIKQQGRDFIVASIIKGSSAEKCGKVQIGDTLLSIEGKALKALSEKAVEALLQGQAGSTVDIVFQRKTEKPFQVELQRQRLILQEGRVDTSFEQVDGGIVGVISLHAFYQGVVSSDKDVRQAIGELEKKGKIKGLILDLRDNRGGFLMQAVKVAGLFIKSGVIVAAKYSDGSLHYFRDLDPSVRYSGPLIVLVSKETASAAEIVTQALKDYGVGIIVGDEQTYGKGSIQMQTVTGSKAQDAYFKVTIGRYYGVSGHSTQLEGVKADVVVPSYLAERKIGEGYLVGTLKADAISPCFDDMLSDVTNEEMAWYQKYYVPFLQQKTEKYRTYIPELVKKSAERMSKNDNYQNLLKGDFVISEKHGLTKKQLSLNPEAAFRALRNMQLQEATSITKDLIQLSR